MTGYGKAAQCQPARELKPPPPLLLDTARPHRPFHSKCHRLLPYRARHHRRACTSPFDLLVSGRLRSTRSRSLHPSGTSPLRREVNRPCHRSIFCRPPAPRYSIGPCPPHQPSQCLRPICLQALPGCRPLGRKGTTISRRFQGPSRRRFQACQTVRRLTHAIRATHTASKPSDLWIMGCVLHYCPC